MSIILRFIRMSNTCMYICVNFSFFNEQYNNDNIYIHDLTFFEVYATLVSNNVAKATRNAVSDLSAGSMI